jgi:5'-nucleotidase/UDP-sugar diphosphatase
MTSTLRYRFPSAFLLLACFAYAAVAADPAASAPATMPATSPALLHVTLLHVNDVHGQLEPKGFGPLSVGGYARLATLADQARAEKADATFLVHCGDEFSKGDALTRKTLGQANIAIMGEVGIDLWTPGNGDFYDGLPNLQKAIRAAKFPTLAANVLDDKTGKCIARESIILTAGKARIAFFGLCTVYDGDARRDGLRILDAIKTAKAIVPELRKQADVVVAVTHLGVDEDTKLAESVSGIDVILGGHSHTILLKGRRANDPDGREVLIAQAGCFLSHCGRVDLELVPRAEGGWKVARADARLIALMPSIPLDPKITACIARLHEAATQPSTHPVAAEK